jgi:hypothetical protein
MTTSGKSGRWKLGLASWLVIGGAIATGYCALDLNTPVVVAEQLVPESNNVLQPISLRCDSTAAGGTNPDQISLYINKQLVRGPTDMNAGMIADLAAVPGITFHKKVRVELHDQSKKLGSAHVSSTGNGTLQFMYGNANYTLTYQVGSSWYSS